MGKVNLNDIVSGYSSATTSNANNDLIETAFDNTLSRDGTQPNTMGDNIDMNSNRITNLPNAVNNTEPVTLGQANTLAGTTNPLTQDSIGDTLWPQTAEEIAASVTPTNTYWPPGDLRRYGATLDGAADDGTAVTDWINVGLQSTPLYHPGGTALCTTWTKIVASSGRLEIFSDATGTLKATATDEFIEPAGAVIVIIGLTFDTWLNVLDCEDADNAGNTDLVHIEGCAFTTIAGTCIKHERPLLRAVIQGNKWEDQVDHCIVIGFDSYADQESWQRITITNNIAIDMDASGTTNGGFCVVYAKWSQITENYIEDITVAGTGSAWGIYTQCRYGIINGNRINLITGAATVYAISVVGDTRGVTTSPQGFAVNVQGNTILGSAVGSGIHVLTDDVNVTGNYVENFIIGINSVVGTALENINIVANNIRGANTVSGTYGINAAFTADNVNISDNIIDTTYNAIRTAASAASKNWKINDNVINNCGNIAITSNNTATITGASISNNTIDIASRAINLDDWDQITVTGNRWTGLTDAANLWITVTDGLASNVIIKNNGQHLIQTTDATVTTIFAYNPPTDTLTKVTASAVGWEPGGGQDSAMYESTALVHNKAGTVAQQGSTQDLHTAVESDATWGGLTLVVSGSQVLVRVTGLAATTINWAVDVTVESVS